MPGYGPQRNYGAQGVRTGQAPTRPDPGGPDEVTGGARGTPQWRQAYAAHEAWIEENIAAGRSLADLGLEPVKGGGLSAYSRHGSKPLGSGGAGAGARTPAPQAPTRPQQQGPGTGGFLPGTEGDFGGSFGPMNFGGGAQGGLQQAILQLLMGGGRGF